MSEEILCPIHGPYPAELGVCPRCAKSGGGRPQAPRPLSEADDDSPTNLGNNQGHRGYDDDSPTVLPKSPRGGHRILDLDEELTNLGPHSTGEETILESKEVGPQAIFWVKEGPRRGRIYKIKTETVIGRKDVDLTIDDPKVSATHAKIVEENGKYIIVDFRSKNGTYVNGERIRNETEIKENDLVKIGDVTFVFKVLG
ncbi:MAG TPA: FHA domain-containing protein [Anaerolineaceae bacterium]|nr:FHA domain-containing protein [Anaerolineaceae bacterium]